MSDSLDKVWVQSHGRDLLLGMSTATDGLGYQVVLSPAQAMELADRLEAVVDEVVRPSVSLEQRVAELERKFERRDVPGFTTLPTERIR